MSHHRCGKRNSKRECKDKCADQLKVRELKACKVKTKLLDAMTTNTENLFINNKLFPVSSIPIKITNATPMPITQQGSYILDEVITKTVEIEGENIVINLANLSIISPAGCGLSINNSNKVFIYDGFIECTNGTAVCTNNSYNIAFRSLNTKESRAGYSVNTTDVLFFQNIFVQNITEYAFEFNECSSIYQGQINISDVAEYNQSLFSFRNSDILFLTKISFLGVNVTGVGSKYGMFLDTCFDTVIDNISFFKSSFATNAGDLLVNDIKILSSSNIDISLLSVTDKQLQVDGNFDLRYHSVNVEDSSSIYFGTGTFEDNGVTDVSGNAKSLEHLNIYSERSTDIIFKFTTGLNNFCVGGGPATKVYAGGVYTFEGGDWTLSGCTFNNVNIVNTLATDTTCIGVFAEDPLAYLLISGCTSNNNGNDDFVKESGGFKFTKAGSFDTIVQVTGSGSVNNLARVLTYSFLSEVPNTMFLGCLATSNEINNPALPNVGAFGFLVSGSVASVQESVSIYSCTANDNFSVLNNSYGVYAGVIDYGSGLTQGCKNLIVKGVDACSNSVGIHIEQSMLSNVLGNFFNINDIAGLQLSSAGSTSVISNTVTGSAVGYDIVNSPDSDIQKNLASACNTGFRDNTASGNFYVDNKAISSTVSAYDTAFAISLFEYNKLAGTYSYVSGENSLTVANVRA